MHLLFLNIFQVYPGLMVTSGTIHWVLNLLNIPIHIRDVCVFLAPIFRQVLMKLVLQTPSSQSVHHNHVFFLLFSYMVGHISMTLGLLVYHKDLRFFCYGQVQFFTELWALNNRNFLRIAVFPTFLYLI